MAGAVRSDDVKPMLETAGLVDVILTPKPDYVRQLLQWNDPLYGRIAAALPEGDFLGDYICSMAITARKPV